MHYGPAHLLINTEMISIENMIRKKQYRRCHSIVFVSTVERDTEEIVVGVLPNARADSVRCTPPLWPVLPVERKADVRAIVDLQVGVSPVISLPVLTQVEEDVPSQVWSDQVRTMLFTIAFVAQLIKGSLPVS